MDQKFWDETDGLPKGYSVEKQRVWSEYSKLIYIWIVFFNGEPKGNLRVIGSGQNADMEFRFSAKGLRHAIRAPMAGSTNPIDACKIFIEKYLKDQEE